MIKINLLPQKRPKRAQAAASSPSDSGGKHLLIGLASMVGAAALVFLIFDLPARSERSELRQKSAQLQTAIKEKQGQLEGYDKLQQQEKETLERIQAIDRLVASKVVPANVLHELGHIMSVRGPTMTEKMRRLTKSDPSKQYQEDWDPTHVWIVSFTDAAGVFRLEGGAQSRDDITQLSKRLAASVYFTDIGLASGERVTDNTTNVTYYKFVITGKVVY